MYFQVHTIGKYFLQCKVHAVITMAIMLGVFNNGWAQRDAILYNMSSIPQHHYTNPANSTNCNFYLNLPAISSIYLDYHNNGFVFSDLITKKSNDSLLLNMTGLLGGLKDNNLMGFTAQIDWLGAGFTKGDNRFFFNISEKTFLRVRYPKDLIRLLWEGNAGFIGQEADLSKMALKASHYREYAFGMSRELNEQWAVGGKVKLLAGVQNISTTLSKLTLATTDHTYELTGASDMVLNTSFIPDDDISALTYLMPGNTNWGAGLDMGANFQLNDQLSFSASIIDLSFIRWKHNVINYSNDLDEVTFKGNAINSFTDSAATTPFETLFDSLAITYDNFRETKNAYTEGVPPRIYLSANYSINSNNHVGALFHGEYFKKGFYPSFTLSYNYQLPKWIGASLSYTAMHRSFANLGAGLSLNLGPIQIYAVSDNLAALFNLAKITGGGIVPQKAKSMHTRLGINLVFIEREKDKDKDGLVDMEDECPGIAGPKEMNGCPDKDGDKIIDKFDDCPDDPGLSEFNGCPDQDNDKIIDKKDKCPTLPGPLDNMGCPIQLHYITADKDTLESTEMTEEGIFAFKYLPEKDVYLFLLDYEGTEMITEVQVITNEKGKVITASKIDENVYKYEKLVFRETSLYLIDHNGDTLMVTQKNSEGFYVFEPLPANQSHLFLLDANENELQNDVLILLIDKDGNEKLITAVQNENNVFQYEYIPFILNADLDLIEEQEVEVELKEEEKEILNTAFSDLEFNIGSAIITFSSYSSLGKLSALLSKKPDWKLKLSGHTDNVGSDKSNLLLSKNRAEAVKSVLTNRGVDANRVIVKYYGESQPIASNNEADGRQKNRRVEMLIIQESLGGGVGIDKTVTRSFNETGIRFRIQLLTSGNQMDLTDERLKNLDGIEVYFEKSMYKYTVGNFDDIAETSDLMAEVLEKGFNQAFIVAFKDGKRITVKKAIGISKSQ